MSIWGKPSRVTDAAIVHILVPGARFTARETELSANPCPSIAHAPKTGGSRS